MLELSKALAERVDHLTSRERHRERVGLESSGSCVGKLRHQALVPAPNRDCWYQGSKRGPPSAGSVGLVNLALLSEVPLRSGRRDAHDLRDQHAGTMRLGQILKHLVN